MLDLCLHCGGHQVDREQVAAVPTPPATRTWQPIPHENLLTQVERSLEGKGLRVVQQAHALWGDGDRYFGLMELSHADESAEYGLVLGLRNSHDKSTTASIALGSQVFVCDNLSFFGEVVLARKHTRFIQRDLPGIVAQAMASLSDMRVTHDERIAAYKQTTFTDPEVHDLLIRAVDDRVLPVSYLPNVLQEWREPSHDQFLEDGNSAWRLHNGFTEALKGKSLALLPYRSHRLQGLLDPLCHVGV
ncbi:MAG: DUF932 domain-containing protein [Planctomycetaceae bacterium]|nr:DUF932 domain-containing protein [Planctomycetaceae bacterium]